MAKNNLPKSGPHDSYPLLIASDMPTITPIMLMIKRVNGGINRVVHLNMYSSENSPSSPAFEVTVKFVLTPAMTFRRP
ncbi:hypothetical protein HanXRQr2_Chr05g0236321 [Helianthus annuus]|uniref:Uncharacterized protein n=1 Tax=Helianthus annuus TaxID=4232 RepID=A0A9K3J3E0_HELAN|nr:hypothetical protein HanXRQr2_Chr05g0236321 [Helianthus annuus]